MGCQASKAVEVSKPAVKPPIPTKTLLEHADVSKAATNAHTSIVSIDSSPPGATYHSIPVVASTACMHPPTSSVEMSDSAPMQVQAECATSEQHSPSHCMLRKQRTICSDRHELDIMVTEFSSHDSTVGSVIGRNCKELRWKVMYDRDASPIDVKVHVQEHKLHSTEVGIESNGQALFTGAGTRDKAKLTEDFHYEWPFRGTIRGFNEVDFFEVRPNFHGNDWYPATITGQREDGYFEVCALVPDASGSTVAPMTYPAISKANLREAGTGKPIQVPEDRLVLLVPKQDPLAASLCLENGDHVTHHFGRPSPPIANKQRPQVSLKVSKDRGNVEANVGPSVLTHFVSGEVNAVKCDAERLRHSWTVKLGPFAEHTVQVMKKHTVGKIFTLVVDGEVLVESSAADIGCQGKEWQCNFRFVGERVLDFEVYKTNSDGSALEETDHVLERRRYVHECSVVISNDWDFTTARFFVDGTPFNELTVKAERPGESNLQCSPVALTHSFGISTPYKVDKNAPSNVMAFACQVFSSAENTKTVAGGIFAHCCDCRSVDDGDDGKRIVHH